MQHDLDSVFEATRELFDLPDGTIYLDGNSLGPLVKASREKVRELVDEQWGPRLISGWNELGWIDLPREVGDAIGGLVCAESGATIACDSTSVNLFKVLSAALSLAGDRRRVLTDSGNFPTDVYVAQGLLGGLGGGHELVVVEPDAVLDSIDEDVAVVMLTQVDYRTGRLHDMRTVTAAAHDAGALVIWDLAHSAGALPVDLAGCEVDFAIGCGYKYLNGGPGAPAFVYVAPKHQEGVEPLLAGWMGHAAPFAFSLEYEAAAGIDRMLVGTPPILAMASLRAALTAWDGVDMRDVRARSIELSELFIVEVEARCPELVLASPRAPEHRGSQVSFRFEEGYAAMQALISMGVVGDFRAPDIMRFGFTPLYVSPADVVHAAEIIERVMTERLWDRDEFKRRSKVT